MLASEARRAGSRFFSPIPKPSFQSFRKVTAETFLTNVLCKNDVVFLITSRPNQTSSVKSFLQNQNRFYISSFKANKCDRKLWSVNVLNYGIRERAWGPESRPQITYIIYYTIHTCVYQLMKRVEISRQINLRTLKKELCTSHLVFFHCNSRFVFVSFLPFQVQTAKPILMIFCQRITGYVVLP